MLLEKEVIFGEDLEPIFGKKMKQAGHEIVLIDIKPKGENKKPKKLNDEAPKKRGRKPSVATMEKRLKENNPDQV